ncbi:MAG: putative alpha/beta-fold hydrolase [Cyclobacteriaceae bacterium]|jgi:predicted alpha/beta-fold hydrolase
MPLIQNSTYLSRPFYMINPHWETIIPSLLYKGPKVGYQRERMELDDGDFLDVDYLCAGNSKCMVITHGLEGDSSRYYVKRTADYFHKLGWDIVAWNCRSCGGEMNRLSRFYHHGETGDMNHIVRSCLDANYESVVLFGYSMGGSMTLKYLGERKQDERIKGAVTFSVPCNLKDSSQTLKLKENQIYEKRFLKKLVEKMKIKAQIYPNLIDVINIDELRDFDEFHEKYTAPLHGFKDMEDFFESASCDQFLPNIYKPVLIVNALNDPMLGEKCYPIEIAEKSAFVYLEMPKLGGHTGFSCLGEKYSWMEKRANDFIKRQNW